LEPVKLKAKPFVPARRQKQIGRNAGRERNTFTNGGVMTSPMRDYGTPETGSLAPRFTLPAFPGGTAGLDSTLQGRTVLLCFYSYDFVDDDNGTLATPTIGLHALSADLERFDEANTSILGISRDTLERHEKLATLLDIRFPLLSDESGDVGEKYGLLPRNRWAGSTYTYDVECRVFIVNGAGTVWYREEPEVIVSPDHPTPPDVKKSFELRHGSSFRELVPLRTTELLDRIRRMNARGASRAQGDPKGKAD
jgi:peroxiredoxin Q/BCP